MRGSSPFSLPSVGPALAPAPLTNQPVCGGSSLCPSVTLYVTHGVSRPLGSCQWLQDAGGRMWEGFSASGASGCSSLPRFPAGSDLPVSSTGRCTGQTGAITPRSRQLLWMGHCARPWCRTTSSGQQVNKDGTRRARGVAKASTGGTYNPLVVGRLCLGALSPVAGVCRGSRAGGSTLLGVGWAGGL